MEEDDFSFDFESKLEEQQKSAASRPSAASSGLQAAPGPASQSAGSFKRNYRQTVCTYWLKGVCALGENCGFLHEYNTERMPVCKTLIRFGICKEPDCPFKHNMEDIKECNMYKLGFCVYGPQCRYRHTRLPGPPPDPTTVEAAKPKAYRSNNERPESGSRGRGRHLSFGRARGDAGFSRSQRQADGVREGRVALPPPRPPQEPPPPQQQQQQQQRPPPMPPHMGYGMMGMVGMPGMMPMGMNMGMPMPPFWRGPPMGRGPQFPSYRFRQ